MTFRPCTDPPESTSCQPGYWFLFRNQDLLLTSSSSANPSLPFVVHPQQIGIQPLRTQFLGFHDSIPCWSGELNPDVPPPENIFFSGLRPLFGQLPDSLFWIAARAIQIVDWDRTHQFCSRCGIPAISSSRERSKKCPACGLLSFPRIAPAVIVRINRGDELLLARAPHFTPGIFSVIAGFVEPGETLEETVHREVHEETGVIIENVKYFASQPWPFPHSLMIAFTASYAGGEIVVDSHELEEAHWFSVNHLPPLPSPLSISRRLIDAFIRERIPEKI